MASNWQDAQELGIEAINFGIDKFHDRAYDKVTSIPGAIRRIPSHLHKPRSLKDLSKRARRMSRNEDRYNDTGYESEGGTSRRRSSGTAQDTYEPQQYGARGYAARDGYQNDGYAQSYAESKKEQQQYLDFPRQQQPYPGGSGDGRSRSYNDLRDSVRDDRSYDDERDDRRSGRGKSRDRERSRSRSRAGSRLSYFQDEDADGNTELKKWGATLAGAVAGGFAGRTMATNISGKSDKKENWVPTAIGAVLGGFAAREAEKEIVKRRHEKHLRKEYEYED